MHTSWPGYIVMVAALQSRLAQTTGYAIPATANAIPARAATATTAATTAIPTNATPTTTNAGTRSEAPEND